MKTHVIGLGNPILADDGVGFRVARALHEELEEFPEIHVSEACAGGLELLELAVGYQRVLLIDAWCPSNPRPGHFSRLNLEHLDSLCPTQHMASAHDTNLPNALRVGERLGLELPEEWVIFAVEVCNVDCFDESLSPRVALAVPEIKEAVLEELGLLIPC